MHTVEGCTDTLFLKFSGCNVTLVFHVYSIYKKIKTVTYHEKIESDEPICKVFYIYFYSADNIATPCMMIDHL